MTFDRRRQVESELPDGLHFVRWTMAIVPVGLGAPLGMDVADWEKLAMW